MFSRYIDNFDYSSRFRILKGGKISLVVSALLGSVVIANAAPTSGVVTSGTATISQNGNTTNINQSSQKASINWQNFNIASNETVNFNQPNTNSITLNRVVGNEKSVINGALNANGQVWILNSNGILFSKDAKVNTSGLVATTAELSDKDFQDGNYNFKNSKSNSVVNLGTIEVANNGYVVLASNEVRNSGTIKAIKGKVYLSGNSEYTINLNGNSIVNLIVTKGVLDAMVENSGTIVANGGEIYLTTNAVNELLKGVVNNTGIIEANSLDDVTGKVEVFAHGGTANVGGEIKAEGGFVETSGKDFKIQPNTKIKAKEWLIDPVSIVVDSTLASTIQDALATADVTISTAGSNTPSTSSNEFNGDVSTNGNIYVVSAITWATAQKLTLSADKDIFINKDITATNSAGKLALYYNQAGNDGNYYLLGGKINLQNGDNFITKSTSGGSEKVWTVISSKSALEGITTNNSSVNYALGANILDASGFTPIGTLASPFKGSFDGLGHTITGLSMSDTTTQDLYRGLFGYVNNASSVIKNIGLENVNISQGCFINSADTGSLIGHLQAGSVENVYATGTVTVDYAIGNNSVSFYYNYGNVGGLIGYSKGNVSRVYSTAKVDAKGTLGVGGLIGQMATASTLSDSYYMPASSTESVYGNSVVGGLVGLNAGSITRAYVLGGEILSRSADGMVGGVIGMNDAQIGVDVSKLYSTAKARSGWNDGNDGLPTSFEQGVSYKANGLVGYGSGPQDSTYDKEISGNTFGFIIAYNGSGADVGKTTADMKGSGLATTLGSSFVYFDGYYPVLKALMTPAAFVKVNSASGTTSFTGGNGYTVIPVQDGSSVTGTMDYIYSSGGNLVPASDFRWYVGDSSLSISGSGLTLVSNTQPTQADIQKSGIVYISGKLSIKNTLAYTLVGTISNTLIVGNTVTLPTTVTFKDSSNRTITPTGSTNIKVFNSSNEDVTSLATTGNLPAGDYTVKATLTDNDYAIGTNNTNILFSVAQKRINYALSTGATASLASGSSFTLPTVTYTNTINGINVTGTPTVKVYNSSNTDVTAQALAGTLASGTYTVKATLTDPNYRLNSSGNTTTTLTVSKASVTYSFSNLTKAYGQSFDLPTPTYLGGTPVGTSTVKVYDSNSNDVTAQATAGRLTPGNYTVKTTLVDNNYELANSGNTFGTLAIGAKPITGTLASLTGIYGTAITLPTATLSDSNATTNVKVYNAQNQDVTSQALNGTLVAGTYTVKAKNSNSNYSLANTTATLTVGAKPITGTLASLTGIYGTAITLPTATLSDSNATTNVKVYNAQNQDVTSQALNGTLVAGTYTVKAENSNSNYLLSNTAGTLTINAKSAITEISLPKINQIFGQVINLDGILSSELISQGARIVVLDASNKDVTELALQGKIQPGKYSVKAVNDNSNYALNSNSIELTINPALDPVTLVKTQVSVPVIPVVPTINAPKVVVDAPKPMQLNQDMALKLGISESSNVSLVSQTIVGQPNQVITLSDLKPQSSSSSTDSVNVSEVRVPLSQNSIVDLVNGGITLPVGVSQQFFIIDEQNNTNKGTN